MRDTTKPQPMTGVSYPDGNQAPSGARIPRCTHIDLEYAGGALATVAIVSADTPQGFIVINAADFDPATMTRYEGADA